MTRRRTVNRFYDELSPSEKYAAVLFAASKGDLKTAREILSTMPTHDVVSRRSELWDWHEAFVALMWELDRELRSAIAPREQARAVRQNSEQTASLLTLVPQMYLCGVAAAGGDADSEEHQQKAQEAWDSLIEGMQPQVKKWIEVESAANQRAADLVHGFDGVCQAAGIDPNVVARGLPAVEVALLEELRETPPSDDAQARLKSFAQTLFEHLPEDAV